jgi:hypothetical protein
MIYSRLYTKGSGVPPASPRKDWYSISVDTLRGWGLLLLLLVLLVVSWQGYRLWERRALAGEAQAALADARILLQKLEPQGKAGYKNEYDLAWKSFVEAQEQLKRSSFRAALASAERCRNILLSISDALSPQSGSGQAQFVSLHGEVEFRRGNSEEWEEARGRLWLHSGDNVRTGSGGSAEIIFADGTLYTARPNTQFVVSSVRSAGAGQAEQAIQMEYGWVDLNTSNRPSRVVTPGAQANVRRDSEAFVAYDRESRRGRYGAVRGGLDLTSQGGVERQVGPLQQVTQTGDLLSAAAPLPGRPQPIAPTDHLEIDPSRDRQVVLSWSPVAGAPYYALQVSRNHLFVDNIINVERRTKTRATLGVRGEGTFQWRVAAFDSGGAKGPWSTSRQFRVASLRSAGSGEKDETPPTLDLADVKSYGNIFIVGGKTEPGSKVVVGGEVVKVDAAGSFTKTVQLTKEGWSFIEIRASDGWGNETVKRHRVFVEVP